MGGSMQDVVPAAEGTTGYTESSQETKVREPVHCYSSDFTIVTVKSKTTRY